MEPKHLTILRHAKSSWDDPDLDDYDRPLSRRGQRAAARVARYVREHGITPDLVLCSTARRTRETLRYLELDPRIQVLVESDLYGATAGQLLARLRRVVDPVTSVLLIGHNPSVQELAIALTGEQPQLAMFPTAALAELRIPVPAWDDLRPGMATLAGSIVPRELD